MGCGEGGVSGLWKGRGSGLCRGGESGLWRGRWEWAVEGGSGLGFLRERERVAPFHKTSHLNYFLSFHLLQFPSIITLFA